MSEEVTRKLTAILAADEAGFSRLMGEDEAGTRSRFNAHLNELIEPAIASRIGSRRHKCRHSTSQYIQGRCQSNST